MSTTDVVSPTLADLLWTKLTFCQCGNPEIVMALLRDALAALRARRDYDTGKESSWGPRHEEAQALEVAVLPLQDAHSLLLRYVLDAAELTEHGGSVWGCWPTDAGYRLLEFLEATPENEWFVK